MTNVARLLVGLSGLFSSLMALGLWFGMERLLPNLGLAPSDVADGLLGRATIRADIAGLFGGMGITLLIAARTQSRAWTQVALLFLSVAFTGRLVGLVLDGAPAAVIPPLVVEGVGLAILLWFRSGLAKTN